MLTCGAKTISKTAFSITPPCMKTVSTVTFRITSFGIYNKNIKFNGGYCVLLCCVSFMMMVLRVYAECHYSECHYAKCHYAKCHYVECHYSECHYAECHNAEYHNADCHYAQRHYAECRYAMCHYTECDYAKCAKFHYIGSDISIKNLKRKT